MKNLIQKMVLFTVALMSTMGVFSQTSPSTIAQPYWCEAKVRFYPNSNPVANSPCYTLDLSTDANTAFGAAKGINQVLYYNGKFFVSFDAGNNNGGVLVYNFSDVYPAKIAGPIASLVLGVPSAGIAIQPSTGDLFIGTFNNGGIYISHSSANFASATSFAGFSEPSITSYVANLKFDASGNLWFTEFDGNNNANGNYIICYKNADKNNFFKIVNPATPSYSTIPISGASSSVYLMSQPEGIVLDGSGNLYVASNNDNFNCNPAGTGTIAKISSTWIANSFLNQTANSNVGFVVPASSVSVYAPPSGSMPGGLTMSGNILYVNDQGQNSSNFCAGSYTTNGTVWKWDVTTAFSAANFVASGIHTTYPGNGSMTLVNACQATPSSAKDILTFTIPSQVGTSTINATAGTIAITMPFGTSLTSLIPTFTISANATVNPLSGVAQNFSSAFNYVVTAQDGTKKTWTVTVTTSPNGIENILSKSIKIYPNPTSQNLTIEQLDNIQISKFTLTNLAGQIILESEFERNTKTISLENFASGFYILHVFDNQNNSTSFKVAKH